MRDLSAAKLTIEPADATSWTAVRNDLIAERKAAMATELEASLSGLSDPEEIEAMRLRYKNKEKAIEAEVDSRVHNFSLACDIEYNVRIRARIPSNATPFATCFCLRVFVCVCVCVFLFVQFLSK